MYLRFDVVIINSCNTPLQHFNKTQWLIRPDGLLALAIRPFLGLPGICVDITAPVGAFQSRSLLKTPEGFLILQKLHQRTMRTEAACQTAPFSQGH